jgi:hypothetical protein
MNNDVVSLSHFRQISEADLTADTPKVYLAHTYSFFLNNVDDFPRNTETHTSS